MGAPLAAAPRWNTLRWQAGPGAVVEGARLAPQRINRVVLRRWWWCGGAVELVDVAEADFCEEAGPLLFGPEIKAWPNDSKKTDHPSRHHPVTNRKKGGGGQFGVNMPIVGMRLIRHHTIGERERHTHTHTHTYTRTTRARARSPVGHRRCSQHCSSCCSHRRRCRPVIVRWGNEWR